MLSTRVISYCCWWHPGSSLQFDLPYEQHERFQKKIVILILRVVKGIITHLMESFSFHYYITSCLFMTG